MQNSSQISQAIPAAKTRGKVIEINGALPFFSRSPLIFLNALNPNDITATRD